MSSGLMCLTWSTSGVLAPTHAASNQCVLGKLRSSRLYFVIPPLPHSMGSPSSFNCSKSAYLVDLTAVASLSGALAWAWIFLRSSGCCDRNTAISWVPLRLLQGSQARQRLLMRSVPPLARATICSISRGTFCLPQYEHALPHFAKRYSRHS